MSFVGRSFEIGIIKSALESNRAELGVIYGRRRVGKSTLLKKVPLQGEGLFFEGLEGQPQEKQVRHFLDQLAEQTETPPFRGESWKEAFDALTPFVEKGKSYVVFDEFPWMASERSELVALLKFYWDRSWKNNNKLTLVLCGSVASFMVKHVLHSRSLHNRKTFELKVDPLPAAEAKKFFSKYRSDFEATKFLCVFGGVPKYLEQINPRLDLMENLDRLCFKKGGFFLNEFDTLFKEQFRVTRTYEAIVKSLSTQPISKEGIAQKLRMKPGGGLGTYLQNLEDAGFIKKEVPLNLIGKMKSKTIRYSVWDEWLRFYFQFMHPQIALIQQNTRSGLAEGVLGARLDPFFGIAFERLCQKNLTHLLERLEIPIHRVQGVGPYFRQPSRKKGANPGVQIDLLIKKKGNTLVLVECKFTREPVGMAIVPEIERKIRVLNAPKGMSVERVLVSASGVTHELEDEGYFHRTLGLEAVLG
ncbi:ATP-binding protein [Bdellovibrionota bacterium FG-2]